MTASVCKMCRRRTVVKSH